MAEIQPADPARFFTGVLADQHYQKGVQYEQQGDWKHALAAYRSATARDPNRVLFLLARGRVCQAHGLEPEAAECYARALTLRPADPVVLYNQAQLFAARGDLERARANLKRIVDGDVDELGTRAAPIFCRLGDVAMRDEDYAAAQRAFERALVYAPDNRYAAASLGALRRFREFERPFSATGFVAPKVALYGYAGAIVLGMPDDDGIEIPAYPGLGFESLEELAAALARFVALARALHRRFDAVVGLDDESGPLVHALAIALGSHSIAKVELAPATSCVLAVSATGTAPTALNEQVRQLRERCRLECFYSAGMREVVWEYDPAPQVVTAPVRLEFPWNRGEASALEHAEAYGAELAEHLAHVLERDAVALSRYVARQKEWYATHPHIAVGRSLNERGLPALLESEGQRQGQLRHA